MEVARQLTSGQMSCEAFSMGRQAQSRGISYLNFPAYIAARPADNTRKD